MERGTGLPGTPHTIHTYICCCRTAEAAMLPPPQCSGSNQLQWYSAVAQYMVQCGTLWYSMVHTGRPTTDLCCRSLAAAERGAATASPLWATDAYLRIYISTYLGCAPDLLLGLDPDPEQAGHHAEAGAAARVREEAGAGPAAGASEGEGSSSSESVFIIG